MRSPAHPPPTVAIACGGTGGHLFPGLAVARQLIGRGCKVTLIISPKEVDQQAVRSAFGVEILTLPAVGLTRGHALAFLRGFWRSYRLARAHFYSNPPRAALAMGGFTSAPPVLAARRSRARTFLHESNTIPGRANRWLSRCVDQCFVGFPQTADRLHNRQVACTGTPVRSEFQPRDAASCRVALGLDPAAPVLLVMGGSQGASGINELVIRSLALLKQRVPGLQLVHLTGPNDTEKVRGAAASAGLPAVVHSFYAQMDLALGAASVAVSRAGASSLAELAAMRLPAVLVPYPAATDNHQSFNAQAFVRTGAARAVEQTVATPELVVNEIASLIEDTAARQRMQSALAQWHRRDAAGEIAQLILNALSIDVAQISRSTVPQVSQPASPDSSKRAGLETCGTAGSEACATTKRRSGAVERRGWSAA